MGDVDLTYTTSLNKATSSESSIPVACPHFLSMFLKLWFKLVSYEYLCITNTNTVDVRTTEFDITCI